MIDQTEYRARIIDKAKSSSILDAAFYIRRFNIYPRGEKIDPLEVFPDLDVVAWEDANKKADALSSMETRLGMAFYEYPGSQPYSVVLAEMKRENPGFSEGVYSSMIHAAAVAMR
jgi:hypothetical protein